MVVWKTAAGAGAWSSMWSMLRSRPTSLSRTTTLRNCVKESAAILLKERRCHFEAHAGEGTIGPDSSLTPAASSFASLAASRSPATTAWTGSRVPTARAVCMNQRTRLTSLARAFHGLEAKALRTNDRLKERKKRYVTPWLPRPPPSPSRSDLAVALPSAAARWDAATAAEGRSCLKQRREAVHGHSDVQPPSEHGHESAV
mmetsp:Transcript_25716/g.75440  ORF Transcript_25716/g.75440 Transcript_25716/m.75440 type:complete len:201 (+) Transcript_25716:153-755(+)